MLHIRKARFLHCLSMKFILKENNLIKLKEKKKEEFCVVALIEVIHIATELGWK